MSIDWYQKHHPLPSPVFDAWWIQHYGPPEHYPKNQDEQDEYYVRKGFARKGWNASAEHIARLLISSHGHLSNLTEAQAKALLLALPSLPDSKDPSP